MKLEAGQVGAVGRGHVIKRPRLTSLLDETDARIILLIAPAGYGKTTLAREWLTNRPHGWYRGSSSTADVAALAVGIAKAASKVIPQVGTRLAARLQVSEAPVPGDHELADLVADDLGDWPNDGWVAFDDYQFACDSEPAEVFLEALASNCPVKMLVASRTRPRWATARKTLYGEIFEIGRAQLAMNQAEAQAVLVEHPNCRSAGLFSLADGWPALIGLATVPNETDLPGDALPEELYGFFAEELYQAATPELQQGLRRIALAPYATPDIAETVLGNKAATIIERGLELGFFLAGREPLELHPLLRTFLSAKFRARVDDASGSLVPNLASVLINRKEWDEAFELASRFADDGVLIRLFESSLAQMVEEARLTTLARWIQAARSRRLDVPVVDLADAELAFRRDELGLAEALACQAARRLDDESRFRSRAYWVAGTSAHVMVNDESALEHFDAAERTACGDADLSSALWGRFLVAEALDREDEAEKLLKELAQRSTNNVDELLRIATGRFLLASLGGDTEGALRNHRHVVHLATRFRNPLIGSAFSNAHTGLLNLAGRYEEALAAAETESAIAVEHALGFVVPFAQLFAATARWGLRNFRAAGTLLAQCERAASKDSLLTWAASVRARISLAIGRADEATFALEQVDRASQASKSLRGEHLAYRSLVMAASGQKRDAAILAERAESFSKRIETSGLVAWARSIAGLDGKFAVEPADRAFALTLSTGNVDALVAAYRASPKLLERLAADSRKHDQLRVILERAHDHGLAQLVGLRLSSSPHRDKTVVLTRREREVLELVSHGLLNKQIAKTLFITEGTVKVHVRRICQKLGVRTRTEAAMRAAELSD